MAPPSQGLPAFELLNLPPQSRVHQRLFFLIGRVREGENGDSQNSSTRPDGFVEVRAFEDRPTRLAFPQCSWEVNSTWFKALVPLTVGPNRVRLVHQWSIGRPSEVEAELNLFYEPLTRPPLQLVILAAKDSPAWSTLAQGISPSRKGQHDAANAKSTTTELAAPTLGTVPPSRFSGFIEKAKNKFDRAPEASPSAISAPSPNQHGLIDAPPRWGRDKPVRGGLTEVKQRFALQALTRQAFHGEQMYRQGFGHRTFSLEEVQDCAHPGADGFLDLASLPIVHVLRSEHSLREFRDADNAQQFKGAKSGGAMHSFAGEALSKADFWRRCAPGSAVGVLILDSTWDPCSSLLQAHAAVGSHGGLAQGSLSHGVMGSHWLWACPSDLNKVTLAFLDQEATNTRYCCNDLGEGRTVSLTINIGSGAMIHEVGHAFDNPHWPSGIMARSYIEWNRAFMTRETHSLRGGSRALKPITPGIDSKENHLHRCQGIRVRLHPAYALPDDPQPSYRRNLSWQEWVKMEPTMYPTSRGLSLSLAAGIANVVIEV